MRLYETLSQRSNGITGLLERQIDITSDAEIKGKFVEVWE